MRRGGIKIRRVVRGGRVGGIKIGREGNGGGRG